MKARAFIATQESRRNVLVRCVDSIYNQVNDFNIYDNSLLPNIADNGKFYELDYLKEDCYYFMMDDDIVYPPDYVAKTIEAIDKYKTIVTYHGRILQEPINNYYKGHTVYDFRQELETSKIVDVGGTGVMAFSTRDFHPKELANHPYKRMSDLVLSEEAAKQGKDIICLSHSAHWIKQQVVTDGIVNDRFKSQDKQIELAKSIIEYRKLHIR